MADPVLNPLSAGALTQLQRRSGGLPWHLRCLPICTSTEDVLSTWLRTHPWDGGRPRAVIAGRQTRGQGQWDRQWQSPQGGVWLSAALPWSAVGTAPGLLGLAVAVTVAERLESLGVPVAIKWPNDLLVQGRKLGGILPRMVHRGSEVRLARVGVGLNVANGVPPGAIALRDCPSLRPLRTHRRGLWTAQVLEALDQAVLLAADPQAVCRATEARLWTRQVKDPVSGEDWDVEGLRDDGALLLRRGTRTTSWTRWEDPPGSGL